MFAAEIRKRRVARMRGYPHWRWHLDEVFVKVNGKLCYLWRAVDHEGEVLEAVVTARPDKAAALKLLKRIMKKYGAPRSIVTDGLRAYSAAMNDIGVAADRHELRSAQQSSGEFASALSAARTGDAALSKFEDAAEVQLSSRPGPQPLQSGAPSRHEASLQAETLCCFGRVARPCGIERRLRAGVSPNASAKAVYFDDARPRHSLNTPKRPQEFPLNYDHGAWTVSICVQFHSRTNSHVRPCGARRTSPLERALRFGPD
jgi:IS1 family transposase